jgi:endonuclease/exonuclease/phosphatase family metal-dependent hydrolase
MKKYLFSLSIVFLSVLCFAGNRSKINVMTFNIRLFTEEDDSLNNWKYRKDNVANAVKFYETDIVGMQEVVHNQLMDLMDRLNNSYDFVGVGRADGKTEGEYSPIFYNKIRFQLINSGTFWLSENPQNVGAKGWDAACERIATWAILKEKVTGKKIFAINTHFDHIGEVARRESSKLILKEINALAQSLPVVLTGDFNSNENSVAYKTITDQLNPFKLYDSKLISPIVYGPSWSFHDFGRTPLNERELIDYIFVSQDIKVERYGVLAEKDGQYFLSDHCPVLAEISF